MKGNSWCVYTRGEELRGLWEDEGREHRREKVEGGKGWRGSFEKVRSVDEGGTRRGKSRKEMNKRV